MSIKMNQDILQGKWKQVKGQVEEHWGRLTDNQLDRIQGRNEELVGLLQESYGYTQAQAQQAVDDFIDHMDQMKKEAHH